MTRLILTGGGTGGHIYPALAIAGGLRERWPQAEMLYIGAKNSLESQAAAAAGLDFQGITAEGWQGRRLGTLARATHAVFQGQEEARTLLKAFEPAAVIGTGGYVCLPVCTAAARLGIPVYIHEQNAFPGLANRLTALWAKVVMVSFEEAIHRLPPGCRKKARLTGLPVRESIGAAGREAGLAYFQLAEGKTTVLAAGGSLGAQSINRAMLHVVKNLYGREDVQILLAAGRRDYQPMAEALRDLGLTWQGGADGGSAGAGLAGASSAGAGSVGTGSAGAGSVRVGSAGAGSAGASSAGADPAGPGHAERVGPAQESQRDPGSARPASPGAGNVRLLSYIERMDLAYAAADVFVGRAGASTLAEIALCRLPAILIPYPFATANHQTFNAASLADKGGAVLLEDRKLTGPLLLRSLQDIIFNEEKRRGMADCAYLAARQRALPDILDILAEVME